MNAVCFTPLLSKMKKWSVIAGIKSYATRPHLQTFDLSGSYYMPSVSPAHVYGGSVYWSGIRDVVCGADRYHDESARFKDNCINEELQ